MAIKQSKINKIIPKHLYLYKSFKFFYRIESTSITQDIVRSKWTKKVNKLCQKCHVFRIKRVEYWNKYCAPIIFVIVGSKAQTSRYVKLLKPRKWTKLFNSHRKLSSYTCMCIMLCWRVCADHQARRSVPASRCCSPSPSSSSCSPTPCREPRSTCLF